MSKSKKFIWLTISFLSGVLLGSFLQVPAIYAFWTLGVCSAALGALYFFGQKFFAFLALCIISLIFGCFYIQRSFVKSEYAPEFGHKQRFEAFVTEDPDVRENRQMLTIKKEGLSQNLLVTTTLSQKYFYGDWVLVEGKITEAKNFSDFDYKKYLEAQNVYGVVSYPKILILKNSRLNPLKESILKVKHAFAEKILQLYPKTQGNLLLGILIGARKGIPEDLSESFNKVGLTHIVAVSGFNISIIIKALEYLSWVLGRRASFYLSLGFIAAFTILTGATASAVRAACMGMLVLLSSRFGRLYSPLPSILATALVMVLISPKILFWDTGFQLSFLATLGIIFGVPVMKSYANWWTEAKDLKEIAFTTICATLATLPLILLNFGRLSSVALFANILVLPVVPYVMALGFLGIIPFFGIGFAFVGNLVLSYVIFVTEKLASVPFASFDIRLSVLGFLIMQGAVFWLYAILKNKRHKSLSLSELEQRSGLW